MEDRDFRIDLLRAFACIMVLFCHAPQVYEGQGGAFLLSINNYYGMAWGPILFFAISGICLLDAEHDAIPFLKKRFTRILSPTIFWSIVYIFLQCFVWNISCPADFFRMFLGILIKPQFGHFWYMYALVSIYLLVPILSHWINHCSLKEIKLYLYIWGISLCLPYVEVLGININPMLSSNGLLYYMSGFLWCTVAGIYCKRYVRIKIKSISGTIISLIILSSPILVYLIKSITTVSITSPSSLFSMLTTLYVVVFIYSIDVSCIKENRLFNSIVNNLSKYSFGIYLCHMCFQYPLSHWIAKFGLNYAFQIPITVIIVGLLSFCVTWCISKIPGNKYIIG